MESNFQCVTECILNETGILMDRKFMPNVAADMAKKALGPKNVWIPVVDDALKVCNEHGIQLPHNTYPRNLQSIVPSL